MHTLTEVLDELDEQGFVPMRVRSGQLCWGGTAVASELVELTDSVALDFGTDPGDDVTVYLLRIGPSVHGYLVLPDSAHADPEKAQLIDRLILQHSARGDAVA